MNREQRRNAERGRDVAAPERAILWDGRRYPMVFNNRTARIVEDVYEQQFRRGDVGYYDALSELGAPKHRALMAFAYAAIVAGGGDVSWEAFDEGFDLTVFEGMREQIQAAVLQSLPEGAPEDDAKNGEAAPEETQAEAPDTPGRG